MMSMSTLPFSPRITLLFLAASTYASGGCSSSPSSSDTRREPFIKVECVHRGQGKDYEVGEGMPYHTLGEVPWESLGPGDSVRIHARKEPYREKILLSNSGTAEQPIVVCGIPDPESGALPIIEGRGATTRKETSFGTNNYNDIIQSNGVIVVFPGVHFYKKKPKYIEIAGLQIQGARRSRNSSPDFTDQNGKPRKYYAYQNASAAASIYIWGSEHITVRGNILTDSGNGLFIVSNGDEMGVARHILVEGNEIEGNGEAGSDVVHGVYTEAIDIVFQYNHFGYMQPGCGGNPIKDRSAGTVVRYNWVEGGGHLLDLVDPGGSPNITLLDPGFKDTYVYGNIFVNKANPAAPPKQPDGLSKFMFHYGGDSLDYKKYRNGTLHFYNNTVVVEADKTLDGKAKQYETYLFQIDGDPLTPARSATVDVRNNIFFRRSTVASAGAVPTDLVLMDSNIDPVGGVKYTLGKFQIGVNWANMGFISTPVKSKFVGSISGEANIVEGNDPGFVDVDGADYHLGANAMVIGKGSELDAKAEASYGVTEEYVPPLQGKARADIEDLGAFGR